MKTLKFILIVVISIMITACSFLKPAEKNLKLGFGKADLTQAAIFEDPLVKGNTYKSQHKFNREEKFAISDRIKGRWRAGSGIKRKLVDSLFVEAMYGEDENGPWTMVTFDECFLLYDQVDNLKKLLIEELKIPKERIVFLPSHGHTTIKMIPKKYQKAVFEAVNNAKNNMQKVEIAIVDLTVNSKKYQINRRVYVKGIGTHNVMFNDYCKPYDEYLDATGQMTRWLQTLGMTDNKINQKFGKDYHFICNEKVDNKLQAILVRNSKTKKNVGSFARYASHAGIVSAKMVNGDVSPDFPGHLKRKLEKELGGIALFAQGPSGDLRPLHKEYSHEEAKRYGYDLANKIVSKYNSLHWETLTQMQFYIEPVNIPLMDNLFLTDEVVEKSMKEIENRFDKEKDPHQRRLLQNDFWRLYRADWTRNMVRPEWKNESNINYNLTAIKLNDETILSTNGEIFSQLGADMVKGYDNVILTTISNEYISYFLPEFERDRGGYTASVAINKYGTSDTIVVSAQRLLKKIYN